MRGEPDSSLPYNYVFQISTHSPRAGRTRDNIHPLPAVLNFNSLAPCGANHHDIRQAVLRCRFQLTRPVRGEPELAPEVFAHSVNFNSLAPCGANRARNAPFLKIIRISTHSPRAGRTDVDGRGQHIRLNFNSLAPCGANPLSLSRSHRQRKFQLTRPVRGEPGVNLFGE